MSGNGYAREPGGRPIPGAAQNPVSSQGADLELSVVIPCLNEAETVGDCVSKALRWMVEHRVSGEVIVADNGSTDESGEIAAALGARVVLIRNEGYGSALMGGIEHARGRYVIIGDADDSYDFSSLDEFVEKLREDFALVQGCRLPSGGGRIMPGAMPVLHRCFGNPLLTLLARLLFHAPIHDLNCGLRGFSMDFYRQLELNCTGMEFAAEMIVKASLLNAPIVEVPVILYHDGRKTRQSHLRTFRDGWRTFRMFLELRFAHRRRRPLSGTGRYWTEET